MVPEMDKNRADRPDLRTMQVFKAVCAERCNCARHMLESQRGTASPEALERLAKIAAAAE